MKNIQDKIKKTYIIFSDLGLITDDYTTHRVCKKTVFILAGSAEDKTFKGIWSPIFIQTEEVYSIVKEIKNIEL